MLPKSKRISKEFIQPVLQKGVVYHSPHFLLRTVAAPAEAYAVLVSKKVAAGAADRNRIRRRIYSFIRETLPRVTKTTHTIISAKPGAQTLSNTATVLELKGLLEKAHLSRLQ